MVDEDKNIFFLALLLFWKESSAKLRLDNIVCDGKNMIDEDREGLSPHSFNSLVFKSDQNIIGKII